MNYKEFKQRMRRQLGMKKHRILREHTSCIVDRHVRLGNQRVVEKAQEAKELSECRKDSSRCGQQNNQIIKPKVMYTSYEKFTAFLFSIYRGGGEKIICSLFLFCCFFIASPAKKYEAGANKKWTSNSAWLRNIEVWFKKLGWFCLTFYYF